MPTSSWASSSRPKSTRASRTMRDRVLAEQPICAEPGCHRRAVEVDHIVGWSRRAAAGMTVSDWHRRSNLQGLCVPHHEAKTKAEAAAGRGARALRKPRRHPGEGPPPPSTR